MAGKKGVFELIDAAVGKFNGFLDGGGSSVIRVISHNDADGITSAAILARALKRKGLEFWVSNVKQFDLGVVELLEEEVRGGDCVFILDFGLSKEMFERLEGKFSEVGASLFIIDHHIVDGVVNGRMDERMNERVMLVNPRLYGEETCTAALTYFFVSRFDELNKDLSYIAVVGMLGDMQDPLKEINAGILDDVSDKMKVMKGLRVFSATRPLHLSLKYADFYIPDVTGDAEGAIELLQQANVKLSDGRRYRTLLDLSEKEMSELITLIVARKGKVDENKLVGNIYLINLNGELYDAKEIATMVNACGRLGRSAEGMEICYGNMEAKRVYAKYRKGIADCLKWFWENYENGSLIEGDGYLIVNAEENVRDTFIGVIMSILVNSFKDKILVGVADSEDGKVKVSVRTGNGVNLKVLLGNVLEGFECDFGGHEKAAGCVIGKKDAGKFIKKVEAAVGNV